MRAATASATPLSTISHDQVTPSATISDVPSVNPIAIMPIITAHLVVEVREQAEHDGEGDADDPAERGAEEARIAGDDAGAEHEPGEGTPDRDDDPHREVPAEAEDRSGEDGDDADDDVVHGPTLADPQIGLGYVRLP